MLTVTSISGNIFHDKRYEALGEDCERLCMSRSDLEKTRIRKRTDKGTDVGLALEAGHTLNHGDVLSDENKTIIVEQLPESVIAVRLKSDRVDRLVLLGHIIGNRHRPISIKDNMVYFPIQTSSEIEIFEKLFSDMIDDIELSTEEMIFTPHAGADVRDH